MIKFNSVCLTRRQKIIFSDLTFQVRNREKRLILGKSGKGKTTLLKTVLGFEPIDSGSIFVNAEPVIPDCIHNIRPQIFYMSQDVDLPRARLSDYLEQIFASKVNPDVESSRLNDTLALFELDRTILDQSSSDLSGGERQRMGLVIGYLLNRPIWLLDEPTSALDPLMKDFVARQILDLDKTMIIISHDPVWQNNDRVTMDRWE